MILFWGVPGARWWTTFTIVICGIVLLNNAVYFDDRTRPQFLLEKGPWASNPLWLTAFYFHVMGASLCLAVGVPLMIPSWTRRYPVWHRRLGYTYVNAVLWVAAPAGILMAPVAKGGWCGAMGFLFAGTLWWLTTWAGYRAIIRGNFVEHVQGMVRSFSLALSAPVFRVFQALLYVCGLDDSTNYVVSLWLSIAASVWLAESYLHREKNSAVVIHSVSPTFHAGEIS